MAAARLKSLAPWTFMNETDIFGVEDPETGELGFVSVMGALGRHYAVAVYRGRRGLYGFLALEMEDPDESPERVLEIPQLQLSFENRGALEREDRKLADALGLTFKGRAAWPLFRSYRPGCAPWFLEAEEIGLLTHAVEQLLDVAPRFQHDSTLLRREGADEFLVRARGRDGGDFHDGFTTIPAPEPTKIPIKLDPDALAAAKRLPRTPGVFQVDLFMTNAIIAEKGARPTFPYALLVMDGESGLILACELLSPLPSLEEMWGGVPQKIVQAMAKLGAVPARILVRSDLLVALAGVLADPLGLSVRQARRLPALDRAKRGLLQHLGG